MRHNTTIYVILHYALREFTHVFVYLRFHALQHALARDVSVQYVSDQLAQGDVVAL